MDPSQLAEQQRKAAEMANLIQMILALAGVLLPMFLIKKPVQ